MNAQEQGPIKSTGTLSVENPITIAPGVQNEAQGRLTISFDEPNGCLYTAYQMKISLPDGMEFFSVKKGRQNVFAILNGSEDFYTDHTIASEVQADGSLMVVVSSNTNDYFYEASGTLFDVYVKASPYAKPGDFQITVKGIMFVAQDGTEDGQRYDYEDQTITAGTVSAESSIPVKVTAANKISTAIFPFSCALPDGLEAYTATGLKNIDDADYITLQKSESIAAFTPYILYAENGIDQTLSGEIDGANYPAEGTVSDGYLTGVLKNTEASAGYVLQNKGDGPKFYKIGSTPFVIPAGKCFANPQSANAPALSFLFDDKETNGIQTATNHRSEHGELYDLQGKRVLSPQSGHIYIINGQKVLKR